MISASSAALKSSSSSSPSVSPCRKRDKPIPEISHSIVPKILEVYAHQRRECCHASKHSVSSAHYTKTEVGIKGRGKSAGSPRNIQESHHPTPQTAESIGVRLGGVLIRKSPIYSRAPDTYGHDTTPPAKGCKYQTKVQHRSDSGITCTGIAASL